MDECTNFRSFAKFPSNESIISEYEELRSHHFSMTKNSKSTKKMKRRHSILSEPDYSGDLSISCADSCRTTTSKRRRRIIRSMPTVKFCFSPVIQVAFVLVLIVLLSQCSVDARKSRGQEYARATTSHINREPYSQREKGNSNYGFQQAISGRGYGSTKRRTSSEPENEQQWGQEGFIVQEQMKLDSFEPDNFDSGNSGRTFEQAQVSKMMNGSQWDRTILGRQVSSGELLASARGRRTRARPAPGRHQVSRSVETRQPATQTANQLPRAQALQAVQAPKCALILQRTYVKKLNEAEESDNSDYDSSNDPNSNDAESSQAANAAGNKLQGAAKQERICITFADVNKAIAEAKRRRGFTMVPSEEVNSIEPSLPVVAELGELNQEVTRILAQKFDLSADEILNGLPMIDMSKTDFWSMCPLMVRPVQCDPTGRFRSFTGHCNNLKNPAWGAAQTPFVRFLAPEHPDGIHMERVSVVDGSPLPSPRLVTSRVHRDHDQPSGDLSLLIMVWGQIIDHDVALAAPPRDEQGMDFNCCKRQHPNCKPIQIPDKDPFYSRYNQKCMDFKRSLAGLRPNCALGPRVHINSITSTIDANTLYGSTKAIADQLRTYSGGLMKVQDVFRNQRLKPLMPQQLDRPDLDCFARPIGTYCFFGGDERVNEQPTLTVLHTLYVRDHNRMAKQLAKINPHWDDDRIYHETRHIQAAIVQHLLINEYLPLLIGHEMMAIFNLTSAPDGSYWDGYDPNVTPSISHGFSTAAFRQGHTFIQGQVRLHNSRTHELIGYESLRNLFKRPFHYYKPGRMDQVLAGIINTPAQVYDPFITEEISGHLFQEPGVAYGMDLPAINLARGREQGTPGYNAYREWCGLPKVETFEGLQPYMNNMTAYHYSTLYKHVDDIDLWSGGISERRLAGAQIGPTFACIIARQFANIKRGDRFWFENSGFPSSFTLDQIREIKKATQARTICYNSDHMLTIQRNVLKLPHPILNPRIPCSEIPDLDLSFWREDPSEPGSFHTSDSET